MKAAFSTDGKTITQSAFCSRSRGMSSGISRISLRTVPLLWSRSSSFSLSADHIGVAAKISNALNKDTSFLFIDSPSAADKTGSDWLLHRCNGLHKATLVKNVFYLDFKGN